jgi:hypothetical protein
VPTLGLYGYYGISQRVTRGAGSGVVGYYRLTGYVRCSANARSVCFGVRYSTGTVIKQTIFGGGSAQYRRLTVTFSAAPADDTLVVFAGCNYSGSSSIGLQIDRLSLTTFAPLNPDLVDDSGFENQPTTSLNAPWQKEGTGAKGIDLGTGPAASGTKNAYIRATSDSNAITQKVAARPGKLYLASARIYTSPNFPGGYLGVRDGGGNVVAQRFFGPSATGYTTVTTPPFYGVEGGVDWDLMMTLFVRYVASGTDSWVRIDDVHMWISGRAVDP